MGKRFRAGMLFVRCAGGVSHHPDEAVAEADVVVALEVLWRSILKLAEEESVVSRS
jgi:allantoate deiminase